MKPAAFQVTAIEQHVEIRRVTSRILRDGRLCLSLDLALRQAAVGVAARSEPATYEETEPEEASLFLRWLASNQVSVRAVLATDLYAAYCRWCASERRVALHISAFTRGITMGSVARTAKRRRYVLKGSKPAVMGPHSVVFFGGAENTFRDRASLGVQIARTKKALSAIQQKASAK